MFARLLPPLGALFALSSCAVSAPTDSAEARSPLLRIAPLGAVQRAAIDRRAGPGERVVRRGAPLGRVDRAPSNPEAAARVSATLRAAGAAPTSAASADLIELVAWCRARGLYRTEPPLAAGDIVFFHNTLDANGDGRDNDWFSDAGVAAKPGPLGATPVRLGQRSVVMTLRHAGAARTESGELLNSTLRDARGRWDRGLAGQLYAGHCRAR